MSDDRVHSDSSSTYSTEISSSYMTDTPAYEFYGFVVYLLSTITFAAYIGWAYLPEDILHSLGVTYYFDKYWAVAMPAYMLVTAVFFYFGSNTFDILMAPELESASTMTDEFTIMLKPKLSDMNADDEEGLIPEISDIPLSLVNQCVYGEISE